MARGIGGEETYTPQVQPEVYQRRVVPRMEPSDIGPALERVGDTLDQKYQADSAAWAGDQLGAFRVAAVKQMDDMKSQVPAGEDPGDFTGKYLAAYDKQATQLADSAGSNPYASRMLQKGIGELRDTLATHSMQWEAAQRVAYRNDSVQKNLTGQLPIVEAHPELATQVGSTLMDQINSTGADPSARLQLARQVHEQLSLAAAGGYSRQNPSAVLTGLNDPDHAAPELSFLRDLNPEQLQAVRTRANQEFVTQRANQIQGVYATGGTTAGSRALAGIDTDQTIPAELRDPIRDQVNRQVNQLRDQRREQFAPQIASLESHIEGDQVSPADRSSAWSLFEKGALNPTQFASVMGGIARAEHKGINDGADLAAAQDAYTQGSPLDPQDAHVKKGVEALFTGLTQGVAPGSSEYANRAVDVTHKVGVAPEPAISWARANLVGGDPQSAASAADLVARLDGANPRAVPFALDEKTKAIAGVINQAVRAGTDPATAVAIARRNADISDDQVKALDARWKAGKLDQGQASALRTRLAADSRFEPSWFASVPELPQALQTEYDDLTREYYRYTGGDANQARDLAAADIKHVWGVSEVNGKRELMAYPPEEMFPGLTTRDVREDIASTVAGSADLKGVDASKVRLTPDPVRTARTHGAQWNLLAPDSNGLTHVVLGKDGNPLVYQLPIAKTDYDAVRSRIATEGLERAKKAQEARDLQIRMLREADAESMH